MGRFINADAYACTGQGILSNNMFSYCGNNPVNRHDPSGLWSLPSWGNIREWLEKGVDRVVHSAIEAINPLGSRIVKKIHYSRNELNNVPQTEQDAIRSYFTKVGESDDKFHQNNTSGGRNRKYISPDGHHEAVYYSNGKLNNTPEDIGTYNVFSSGGNAIERYLGHGIWDVLPYMLWGNSPEDNTTIVDRIVMIFQ